jgi:hypothetical protein
MIPDLSSLDHVLHTPIYIYRQGKNRAFEKANIAIKNLLYVNPSYFDSFPDEISLTSSETHMLYNITCQ